MPTPPDFQNTYIATKLPSPVVISGITYAYFLKFYPAPSNNNEGSEIVTGQVHSVVNLGSGLYKVICVRGPQSSSYTKVIGPGDSSEVEFVSYCGGNICNSKESMRVLSFNNEPMASAGSLSAIRCQIGDGFRFEQAGKTILYEVRACEAYADRPTSVNYNPDSPKEITQYFLVDVTDVAINLSAATSTGFDEYIDGGKPFFDSSDADFAGCALNVFDGSTFTELTQWVYENPHNGNAEEPEYLTGDWGSGLTKRYWYNPRDYSFRITPDSMGYGSQVLAGWWLKDVLIAPAIANDNTCAIESETAYEGTEYADQYPASAWTVTNDFDVFWKIEGEGVVFWRDSAVAGSQGIFAAVDGAGTVSLLKRDELDGARSALLADFSLSFPMYVRLVKTGANVDVYTKQHSGDSWTHRAADYPTSLDATNAGLIGFGRGSVGVSRYSIGNISSADRKLYCIGDSAGKQHIYRFKFFDVAATRTYSRASTNSIKSIKIVSDGVPPFNISAAGTDQRNHYTNDSTTITFGSCTDGDKVKVIYNAPAALPYLTGQAPRNSNNPFCSEVVPGSADFQATSNIDHNLFNWRDTVTIKVEDAAYVPAAGDSFTIVRGAGVWSQSNPPTLYWAQRNGADSDWTAIDPADYYLRCYQGVVLLTQSFYDSLPSDFCIKAEGRRYTAQGVDESVLNEIKSGIGMLDELYFECLTPTGAGTLIQGYAEQRIGAIGLECVEGGGRKGFLPSSYGRCHHLFANLNGAPGALASDPAYYGNPDGGSWYNGMNQGYTLEILNNGEIPDETISCPDATTGMLASYQLWDMMQAGNIYYEVYPFGGAEDWEWSFDGTTFSNWVGAWKNDGGFTQLSASFQFQSIPVSISETMKRLPDGCTILDAKMEVRFNNAWFQTWSKTGYLRTHLTGTHRGNDNYVYVNGELESHFLNDPENPESPINVINSVPQFVRSGQCNFDLVGVRLASSLVVNKNGTVEEHPTTRIISMGGSHLNSTATSDKWCVVDVTGMAKQMYAMRNSLVGYDRWYLYPSAGQPSSVATETSWAGYIMGQLPSCSVGYSYSMADDWIRYEIPQNGVFLAWETVEIAKCVCKVRMPGNVLTDLTIPLITPKR